VLLLVAPAVAVGVALEAIAWSANQLAVAEWAIGISLLLGLIAWKLRTATFPAALLGSLISASLIFATASFPYQPWRTALVPLLTLLVITSLATRWGRSRKEGIGTAESRQGRDPAQVAANLGFAALVSSELLATPLLNSAWFSVWLAHGNQTLPAIYLLALAALAESGADTVSSEIGQVLGGTPRLLTTLRPVDPGTDGGITFLGTMAGIVAAALIAFAGTAALGGGVRFFAITLISGVFGLFFDSLLGATLERRGWLNNDAVNFLSTVGASAFALALLAFFPLA
jgi:uncharacterized protein (TIGR00297 family)